MFTRRAREEMRAIDAAQSMWDVIEAGNTLPKFWKRLKVHGAESGLARFKETSTYLTDIIVEDVKEAAISWLPISRGSVCCDVVQVFNIFRPLPPAHLPGHWNLTVLLEQDRRALGKCSLNSAVCFRLFGSLYVIYVD